MVNERDEVVGRRSRSEVHRLGLLHRAVHVLVFNEAGEVFVQKRSMLKDRQPGVWDSSASGHVDSGEAYDACAIRELREELGMQTAAKPKPLFKLVACPETDHEHVWVYRLEAEGPFTLHPEEIETGKWVSPVALNQWIETAPAEFASAFVYLWQKLRRSSLKQ